MTEGVFDGPVAVVEVAGVVKETSVTATGVVSGGNYGINSRNTANTTDLTINAASVTGGNYGIFTQKIFA